MNKIDVRDLKDPGQLLFISTNEYGVVEDAFVLQVSVEDQNKWQTALKNAKTNYELLRSEYGLREDFLYEDLPSPTLSKNKVRRMLDASNEKDTSSEVLERDTEKDALVVGQPVSDDRAMRENIVRIALFLAFNIIIARLVGLLY